MPPEDPAAAIAEHLELAARAAELLPELDAVARRVIDAYASGGRVLAFGNGGSAAEAQHLTTELVGRYQRERRPLAALTLGADGSAVTCIGNDYSFEDVFARQVRAFARPGDVVIGFTTSGRSPNVVAGLEAGREQGATTVVFGGGDGTPAADHALIVPSSTTARIQEVHLLLLHLLAERIDAWAAGEAEE